MASDVKWIKIATDIFDDEKIIIIESQPDADAMIVIWFKILALAGKVNTSGVLMINERIAYTDEMLATIFRRKISQVQMAIKMFEKLGMIEVINGVVTIPNWNKHQKLDLIENRREYQKEYMRERRDKQKQLALQQSCKPNSETNSKQDVSTLDNTSSLYPSSTSISQDVLELKPKSKPKVDIVTMYFDDIELNNTFIDFVNMRKTLKNGAMTNRAITMMVNKLKNYDVKMAIQMLEQSIVNNWKDVYEVKQGVKQTEQQQKKNAWEALRNEVER